MCTEQEHGHEIYPIPVVEKGLEINGFINKNTEYIELDYGNLDYVTYLLLKRLREYINRYLPELDQVFVTCKLCGNDYTLSLPDQKAINNAIEKGQIFPSKCKRCNTQNNLNPMTFDIKEHFKLAS